MPLLSVVIITLNEERNIGRCLESIQGIADDIVVVDSFSSDQTENICKKYSLNFIQRKWEGYSSTKNFANTQAKHDWILSLDADEALSDELKRSILELKKKEVFATCTFNRLTNYCGSWIKHCGWYPDKKLRIFDRRITSWKGDIHEELVHNKPVSTIHLAGDCLHYSYYTVEEHYKQADKFSTLSAANMFAKGKSSSGFQANVRAAAKFLRNYIFKLGFLDGGKGYVVCRITAYETWQKYHKLSLLQVSKK